MLNKELTNKIKNIGLQQGKINLIEFLPNLPTLRGSEPIFTISHANAKNFLDEEFESFIKGLHYIELKYRELTNHDFGFGSPSPTAKVIDALERKNPKLGLEMRNWVAANGGNYYIKKLKTESDTDFLKFELV